MNSLKDYVGKMVVISSKNCAACKDLKERVKADPEKSAITVFLDIEDSQLAKDLSEVLNVRSVPKIISIDQVDPKVILVCNIEANECVEIEREEG